MIKEGADGANPAIFPNTVYNAAAGQVAIKVGTTGPTSTVTAGHAAGASSLCYGVDLAAPTTPTPSCASAPTRSPTR